MALLAALALALAACAPQQQARSGGRGDRVPDTITIGATLPLTRTESKAGGFYAQRLPGELTLADRKRLEMARALATGPRVLLLDEVVAGLNPVEAQQLVQLIRQIRERGVSIIMIEHVMQAVMSLSDRVMVLDHGRKIAEGRPDEVASDPKVIEAYLGHDDDKAQGDPVGADRREEG